MVRIFLFLPLHAYAQIHPLTYSCFTNLSPCAGQAPSDHLGFAELLVDAGIDSISLNPDSVLAVRQRLAKHEATVSSRVISQTQKLEVPGSEIRKAAAAQ